MLKNELEESVQIQMILVNIFIKAPLTDVVIYIHNKIDFIAPIILIIIALSLEYVVKLFAYNKLLDISTPMDLFIFIIFSAVLSLLVGYGILSSGLICFLSLLIGVFAIIKFLTSISLDTVGALVDLLIEMFSDD